MPKILPHVDLDALDVPIGTTTLNGRTVGVHALDALGYEVYLALGDAAAPVELPQVWEAAARVVPELSLDDVRRLKLPQLGALLALAAGQVRAVEDRYPNSDRPTAETTTPSSPPASSPASPSDSSPPASPAPTD